MAVEITSPGTKGPRLEAAIWPLTDKLALSRTTPLPGTPTDGDIYIVPSDAGADANKIALRFEGAWLYLVPLEGWTAYVADTNQNVQFDGTAWNLLAAGISDAPSDGTIYGRKDAAWMAVPSGANKIELSFFAGGTLTASELLFRHEAARAFTIPAGMTGSRGSSGAAATGTPALSVKKNGVQIGTATWSASGTTATLAMASATAFAIGDILSVTAPGTADATLADVSISIVGDL